MPEQPRKFRFGSFLFDAASAELHRSDRVVHAPTLSLNLLAYLLIHRERVVERRELVREVWGGTVVSEGSLRQAIWELRQMLDDSAESQTVIRTVRGRGYQFVAPLQDPAAPLAAEGASAPGMQRPRAFVGRAAELELLQEALRAATHEGGRACALSGAAGLGKTWLAHELSLLAAKQGIACAEVAADPDGAAPAFWPWLQLLRGLLGRMDAEARASLTQRYPGALPLLQPGSLTPAAPMSCSRADPRAWTEPVEATSPEQFAAIAELSGLIAAALAHSPTLLVLEDLQWADEGTLALLRYLLQLLPQTRALLVVTCRAQRARENRPLARTIEAIQRSATGSVVELASFALAEVAELLALRATRSVAPEVASQIFAVSQGNPLFASELALLLAPGGKELADLGPSGAKDFACVIQRRVLALGEDVLHVVCAAAVLGPEFSLAELAAVAEQSAQQVLVSLGVAIEQRIIVGRDETTFAFAHPLTRQAAYDLHSLAQRCRLHGLAGAWLERFSIDVRGTRLNELAHHFYRAAPEIGGQKAVHYALLCAQQAYDATAYQDAVAHYHRALTCMDLDPTCSLTDKLEVALQRAEALRASGADTTRVNAQFRSLAEQAESIGEATLFARAVLGYTGQRTLRFTPTRFVVSCNREETELITRALDAIGPEPSEQRALLLCSLMGALLYSTEKARRDHAAEEATAIARTLGTPSLLVRVLTTKFYCCPRPQNADARLADCDELLEVAERHGLHAQQIDGLITRALSRLSRGEVQLAARDEERARALAKKHAHPRTLARSELIDLMRAFWMGDVGEARRLTQRAFEVAPEDLAERALYMMRCSTICLLESGLLPDSAVTYETMLRAYPEAVGVHCALASCHATLGNREQAVHHFELAAADGFRGLPEHLGWLGEMALLADAAAWLDDAERARLVYDKLEPFGHVFDFFAGEAAPAGPVAYWLAGLAVAFRDLALGRKWLAVARELNARLGATMLDHYSYLVEARLEELRGETGRAKALALLDQVQAYAEPRGLRWLSRCAQLRREHVLARSERIARVR